MRILFERSGGIMGLQLSLDINVEELPRDQAEILRLLLDESHFLTLPDDQSTTPAPDGFQYTITVETGTIAHTIHTSDTTAPDKLRPLIEDLSQRARSQRKPNT